MQGGAWTLKRTFYYSPYPFRIDDIIAMDKHISEGDYLWEVREAESGLRIMAGHLTKGLANNY